MSQQPNESENKAAFAERLKEAVAEGGCPKCGSMNSVAHQGLRQCTNCGNRFPAPKKEDANPE